MRGLTILIVAALASTGCYKASIQLKAPQQTVPSLEVDNNMHVSLIGLFELSKPIALDTACAGGVVAIDERVGFLGGLVNMVLGTYIPVLSVMNPTALCGMGVASDDAAPKQVEVAETKTAP